MSVGKSVKVAVDMYNHIKSVKDKSTVMVYDKSGAVKVTIERVNKGEPTEKSDN